MQDHDGSGITGINEAVSRVGVLSVLPEIIRNRLPEVLHLVSFSEGEEIYSEGSEGLDFFFILDGGVEATRLTPLGVQHVARLGVGDLCGEVSLIDGKARSTGIRALKDGSLLRFDAFALAELIREDPEVESAILRIFCRSLAGKIRQGNGVMAEIMAAEGESRRSNGGSGGRRQVVDGEFKKSILREYGMARGDLDALANLLEGEHFDSGDAVFLEGDHSDTLYIVAEGRVRISKHLPGMGEEALAILGKGEVFGEMAWIDASPRSADAIAHTGGCTVLGISREDLDGSLGSSRERQRQFLKLICQILCRKIRNMNDQLVAYRTMAFF